MYKLWVAALSHRKSLTLKAWQSLTHSLTKQLPIIPRTHRISAGRPMLAKYVTVILFNQFIPNPYLTRKLISCWAVFNFKGFLCANSGILAKGCVERAKTMQNDMATDPSFVFLFSIYNVFSVVWMSFCRASVSVFSSAQADLYRCMILTQTVF